MNGTEYIDSTLGENTFTWLVTGAAGFIGSNLVEALLTKGQQVIGLDNFATGKRENLEAVRTTVGSAAWSAFEFSEIDITDIEACNKVFSREVDFVLHQAALGSVPRSVVDPLASHNANATGFLNMLIACRDNNVKRTVYAASSSTYGDSTSLPKVEDKIGNPLSPYAVTKYVNELYARVFSTTYDMSVVGLRYFNVFGRRQDPHGPYAAVIPLWMEKIYNGETVQINGDGQTSRDFCYIENVIQANLLAALVNSADENPVYNIAFGEQTDLNGLFGNLCELWRAVGKSYSLSPFYADFREGDVRHSLADISLARDFLGYEPRYDVRTGLEEYLQYWIQNE